jgi:putative ABC transport system permease protein
LFRLLDTLLFTLERLWQNRVLVMWTLVGLITATTLALSLSLYIDAVNTNLLESRLTEPPYAFRFRYLGAWEGNITQGDIASASAVIEHRFTEEIGAPVRHTVNYVRGSAWSLRMPDNQPLGTFNVGALNGAEDKIEIVAGEWPPESPPEDEMLPVMISEAMFYKMGIQVGDELTAAVAGRGPVTLKIMALWRPQNGNDPEWIFPPKFFDEIILTQEDALWETLADIERPVEESAWYIIFDGADIRTSDIGTLLSNIISGERLVVTALPGTRLDLSPRDGLEAFNREVTQLTQQLVVMVLPVAGLVLYFVSLVAGLLVSRQQQDDVTLRSRGMSRWSILGVHVLMWLLLAGIALGISILLAPLVVGIVGQTTSFLQFDPDTPPLTIHFTPQAILAGAITALIATVSGLFLAWRTTSKTITSFRQESARASAAWWQRIYLDVILLAPALYVLYTLWRQGGIVSAADDPFSDPLTFLGPTLFSLSLTLFFLRLWPAVLRIAARILSYGRGIALLMALRELTRSIGRYRGTLLMMCFTLSLTGFTASMASTIDQSLADAVDYKIGADLVVVTVTDAQTEQETDSESGQTSVTITGFNVPPVDDLAGIDGVTSVSRMGRFQSRLVVGSQRVDGTVLGLDRAAIAAVTRFREDYAVEPVADLFNRLAGQRNGILISTTTALTHSLLIGQEVTLQISALGEWYETKVPILGILDYFPTLTPSANSFFALTNIDPIFELVGTQLPHDVWLGLSPDADVEQVQADIRASGFPVLQWQDPQSALELAQAAPSRRGVLGFLSVGFVASITLTLISTIIQNTASFRAQVAQLGSLRAMGLGGFTVSMYLTILQGMIAASGIISGTLIGVATTLLFLPLLDFSGGLPPYLVRVAWNDIIMVYLLFAGVLVIVTLMTTILLGRQSLSTVLKLGDA